MTEKGSASKKFSRSGGGHVDQELAETRAKLQGMEESQRRLEDVAKQKVEENKMLTQQLNEMSQRANDAETESARSTSALQHEIDELKANNTHLLERSEEKEKTIQSLERQVKTITDKCERVQSQEALVKRELQQEKDRSEAARAEARKKEVESQNLSTQLAAAVRDLASEREHRSKSEEARRAAEMRVEELLAALEEMQYTNEEEKHREQEKIDDLWKQRSQYFYVAALSACATAAVVSIFFKHYTKV